jgi:hypothetical protein
MNMRRLMTLVEGYVSPITEAHDYLGMFAQLFKFIDKLPPSSPIAELKTKPGEEIVWAKRALKKNDRIVWYLRLYRMLFANQLSKLSRSPSSEPFFDQFVLPSFADSMEGFRQHPMSAVLPDRLHTKLEHFLSLPIPKIQNTIFGKQSWNELILAFEEYEREWKTQQQQHIEYQDEEIIERFQDGFMWVRLPRGSCPDEGEAMGHCGNVGGGYGANILSLRQIITQGSERFWRPSLTFILHRDGYLGEMKGRGNDKPAAKYHPHILALLMRKDIVKGIRGGGYLPENNFAVSDLTEEQQDVLFEARPELATAAHYYRKHGIDDTLKGKIVEELKQLDLGTTGKWIKNDLIVKSYSDWQEAIEYLGDKNAQHFAKYMSGEQDLDVTIIDSDLENLLDSIPKSSMLKIEEHIAEQLAAEGIDEDHEDYDDYDPSSTSSLLKALEDFDSDMHEALTQACYTGQQHGTEAQIQKAIESAINDFDPEVTSLVFGDGGTKFEYDTPVYLIITCEQALKLTADMELATTISEMGWTASISRQGYWDENKIKVDEPHYGFNEFDEDAALDSFFENIDDKFDARPTFPGVVHEMSREQKIDQIKELHPQYRGWQNKIDLTKLDTMTDRELSHALYQLREAIRNKR